MCGLISIIAKEYNQQMTGIFKQLLYVGALRGWDGTGIFNISHQNKITIHKKPGPSSNLIHYLNEPPETPLFGKILVGHNRAATHGSNTEANTHPFTKDHITLVHNGTIFGHRQLANTDVDSEAICHYLTNHTPQQLINTVYGAYALIWYNQNTNTLNILRNEQRPLFLVHTKDMYVLVSEKEMAIWILTRSGIPITKIEEIKPFNLYTFNSENTKEYTRTKLNKKKETTIVTTQGYQNFLGITRGSTFDGFCYECKPINNTGSYKCYVILDKDMTEEAIFYSNKDWTGDNVNLTFSHITREKDFEVLFGHTPVLVKQIEVPNKKKEPILSINGTVIDEPALKFLQGRNCIKCKAPFSATTVDKSHVELHEHNNKVYAYTYRCPKCI